MFQNKQELRKVEFEIIKSLKEATLFSLSTKEIKEKLDSSESLKDISLSNKEFAHVFSSVCACGFILDRNGSKLTNITDVCNTFDFNPDKYKDEEIVNDVIVFLDPVFSDIEWSSFELSLTDSVHLNEPSSLFRIAHRHLYGK